MSAGFQIMQKPTYIKFSSVITTLFVSFCTLYTFDGVIKGIFLPINLLFFAYLKDIIIFLLFICLLFHVVTRQFINKWGLYILLVLLMSIITGLMTKLNLLQILFTFKLIVPISCSFILMRFIKIKKFLTFTRYLLYLAIIGVFLNRVVIFPWSDLAVTVGDLIIQMSSKDYAGEFRRISGFGYLPGTTAVTILVFWLLGTVYNIRIKRSNKIKNLFITIFSGVAIIITTSKSAILAFFILATIVFVYSHYLRRRKSIHLYIQNAICLLSFIYLLAPLVMSYVYTKVVLQDQLSRKAISSILSSEISITIVGTLLDRVFNHWPLFFSGILTHPEILFFGSGLGTIGTGSVKFSNNQPLLADNMVIHIIGNFGIIIALILIYFMIRVAFNTRNSINKNIYKSVTVLLLITLGTTFEVLENGLLMIVIPILLNLDVYSGLRVKPVMKLAGRNFS